MIKPLFISFYSPIHIGTGDELEPFEYIIDDDNMLYTFSFHGFVESLSTPEKAKLMALQRGPAASSFKNVRNFVKHRFDKKDYQTKIPVSQKVADIYRDKFGDIRNMLTMAPFIKTMNKLYVPGSSLKGALRTAVLNYWADRGKDKIKPYTGEEDILKTVFYRDDRKKTDITADVFKYLKIPDINLTDQFTWFTKISNFNLKEGHLNETRIQMLKEVTCSRFYKYDGFKPADYEFEFKLNIDEEIMQNRKAITGRRDLTFETLWKSLDFYRGILKKEKERWSTYNENLNLFYEHFYDFLSDHGKKDDIKIIKLGFGSGFEAVTIEAIRDTGKKYGKSINLVEGLCPLGWAILRRPR